MNNTQEFIYKGSRFGFSKYDILYVFSQDSADQEYYIKDVTTSLRRDQRVVINYDFAVPYRKGNLLIGGVCHE